MISGKDPPRDSGSCQVNFSEGGHASGSRPDESGGRVHRVNWSFMVNSGGWELLDHYASDSEFESSEESEGEVDPVLTAAPKRAEKPSSSTRRRRYKVALKTVLEALAAETDDEETQRRLKKKEYKAARQEAKRQKDREHEAKREASFQRKKQGQTVAIGNAQDSSTYDKGRKEGIVQSSKEGARSRGCALLGSGNFGRKDEET